MLRTFQMPLVPLNAMKVKNIITFGQYQTIGSDDSVQTRFFLYLYEPGDLEI